MRFFFRDIPVHPREEERRPDIHPREEKRRPDLGNDDENGQAGGDDQVDPEDPAQEREVGSDGRAEQRLDLFDARLPRHQERHRVEQFSFHPPQQLSGRPVTVKRKKRHRKSSTVWKQSKAMLFAVTVCRLGFRKLNVSTV